MSKPKTLVLLDFSAASDAALDFVLATVDAEPTELVLLHVWQPSGKPRLFAETLPGRALMARLERAQATIGLYVTARVEVGSDPAQVIVDILAEDDFDVVVLGGPRKRRNLAARVAEQAFSKVITVTPARGTRKAGPITVSWNRRHDTDRPAPSTSRPVPKGVSCEGPFALAGSGRARAC